MARAKAFATLAKSSNKLPVAAIFDMDGVLVDSNPLHIQKWIDFLNARHIPFEADELPGLVLGQRNDVAFRHFFGSELAREECKRWSEELEENFRRAFRPQPRTLPGLRDFLEACQRGGLRMALASSAMSKNVEFVLDVTGFRPHFTVRLSGEDVTKAKPDPEIYLKAAAELKVPPGSCAAFEDSTIGIEAAKRAGMKCVAIASTFPSAKLREETQADLVVEGFEGLTLERVQRLFTPGQTAAR